MRLLTIPLLIAASTATAYSPRPDLESGHFLKALAEADAVLKQDPGNALAHAARSQALSSLMRFPEALEAADRALALNPRLADALLARGLAKAGTAVQQRSFSSLRNVSQAMDDLRAATEADPTLVPAWMSLGLGYEQLPGLIGGSTRRALQCAESLRKVNPAKADVLQGTILSMEGRWSEAQPFFGRGLSEAPADPDVVSAYLEALGSRETRKQLGEAAQRQQLAAEGRRLLAPVKGRARGVMAVCDALLDAGQPEEAWRVAQEALPGSDAPSLLRLQLGKLAARAGVHRDEGLALLDQVVKEPLEGGSGGYASAHWRRGQILRDLGRTEEAKAAGQKALAYDPKHPGARKLLESLGA
ncbi:MAG TPA: tetratricopeptide repeat protein [Holophagaceae bacterium]|nr:tetratricopeptide repeat protein [Holophagaceae bacterium]